MFLPIAGVADPSQHAVVFNPSPTIERIALGNGQFCYLIDDALLEPQQLVEWSAAQSGAFRRVDFNTYPEGFPMLPPQFTAFNQDAVDDKGYIASGGKLAMPVLALGGEKSFGPMMATVMRAAADNVQEGVIPDSGHWIMEENPTATVATVRAFLDAAK